MKEHFKMVLRMEKVYLTMKQEINIQEIGNEINFTVMVIIYLQGEKDLKESLTKEIK